VKILLVEDDDLVRDFATQVLEEAGYGVRTAALPSEAEAIAEAGEPVDLLITDIVMPERDGVELARRLLRRRPGLKVLFTTGYTRHIAPEQLAGAEILDKPYHADALLHAVQRLIGLQLA
jgi:CheY-like chemotaxis protein